jgi:hypothetical protein
MGSVKRLINANELLAEVVKAQALEPDKAIVKIITLLTEAESVDAVEVVHAKWTGSRFNPLTDEYEEYCTHCGAWSPEYYRPYCSNCGAMMDG